MNDEKEREFLIQTISVMNAYSSNAAHRLNLSLERFLSLCRMAFEAEKIRNPKIKLNEKNDLS